jgi:voltage-gated sodium channel
MAAQFEDPAEFLEEKNALDELDTLFLIVFSIEVGVNAYANWFLRFFRNPWSVFDLIVVGLSLIGLAPTGLPLSLVLLLRCCRVLRVFGRFRAVSSIFSALAASAVPLASTFFIIFVFASICACPPPPHAAPPPLSDGVFSCRSAAAV